MVFPCTRFAVAFRLGDTLKMPFNPSKAQKCPSPVKGPSIDFERGVSPGYTLIPPNGYPPLSVDFAFLDFESFSSAFIDFNRFTKPLLPGRFWKSVHFSPAPVLVLPRWSGCLPFCPLGTGVLLLPRRALEDAGGGPRVILSGGVRHPVRSDGRGYREESV